MHEKPHARQRTGRLRRVLLGFLFALFLVAALEGGARLLRPPQARAQSDMDWMEPSAELGWRNKPGFRGTAYLRERAFDEQGLFTVDTPAATAKGRRGRRLILLLGDSRTFGNGVPVEETYGEILDRRLPEWYYDFCHFGGEGHHTVAALLAAELARMGGRSEEQPLDGPVEPHGAQSTLIATTEGS